MVLIEEDCSLCGVAYPYFSLYRCHVCRRLYCRNCFLYDIDRKIICLKCAKRRVSPRGPRSKYTYLTTYLANRAKYSNHVTLPFTKVEAIIGDRLPSSAHYYEHWWSNARNRSPSEAWLTAGWRVVGVNLDRKEVTFRKDMQTAARPSSKRRRRKPISETFKALARRRRPWKPPGPSKTRVARVQARARNIERRRSSGGEKVRKFKPRKTYEKRLYKLEEKPE